MKIRLAKKIMKYKSIVDEYNNGDGSVCDGMKESYWLRQMFKHINGVYDETFDPPAHIPFKDHRIVKAISLTNHWNARRYINELIKSNKKHPFKLRDVQRDAERLIKTVQRMKGEERCCGNCHRFDNEDVYGVGWCSNNEHESSCDQVCDEHEF